MDQHNSQLRSSLMHRLRAGLPLDEVESTNWVDVPASIQQLSALMQKEVDRAAQAGTSLLAFRIRHRPFGLAVDDNQQLVDARPELRQCLEAVHPGIRAVGSQSGELIGFAPGLQRRSDGADLLGAITKALAEPLLVDGLRILLGPRAGGAVVDSEADTVQDLLAATKLALAETNASRNAVMFHPYQKARQDREIKLAQDLHEAVIHRQITSRYQPDIDLNTGQIAAIKAYAHWSPTGGGSVLNSELFAAAERATLLVPIGREVIEEALRTVYHWITTGLLSQTTVWVNVHPQEVLAPDFESAMTKVVTFDERLRLGLELTEHPAEDQQFVFGVLRNLMAKGAATAMGGFGTGKLNLADFQTPPFSAAKFDRSLTRQITSSHTAAETTRLLAELAQLFEMELTAHGIENAEQLQVLRDLGCNFGQGFYFGRPIDATEMQELLTQVRMGRKSFI